MGKKSRRKGVIGEQEVARKLASLFGLAGADREVFVRTKIGVRQTFGDIVVPPEFPFVIEVKNRPNPLHSVINFTSPFRTIVEETVRKLSRSGKTIVLATKIGKPSKFYYFLIIPEGVVSEGGELNLRDGWTRPVTVDGTTYIVHWITEERFLREVGRYVVGLGTPDTCGEPSVRAEGGEISGLLLPVPSGREKTEPESPH